MQKSCFHRAVPKRAEESRREPTKAEEAEVSRAKKREECLYFVAQQRLATHVTRLVQQKKKGRFPAVVRLRVI
jgi:hypothetical protein